MCLILLNREEKQLSQNELSSLRSQCFSEYCTDKNIVHIRLNILNFLL